MFGLDPDSEIFPALHQSDTTAVKRLSVKKALPPEGPSFKQEQMLLTNLHNIALEANVLENTLLSLLPQVC